MPNDNNYEQLSKNEAKKLHDSILGYVEENPAIVRRSAVVHHALQRGISLVLLAAFPSLTLLYIAGKALPSHGWLYEVKRGAEEVAVYLQPDTASRLSYRTQQINRRVSEVTQLTLSGSVNNPSRVDRLERDLVGHVAQIEADLKQLEATSEEAGNAKSQLAAKTKVLGVLAKDENTSVESKASLKRMLAATSLIIDEGAAAIAAASSTPINHDQRDKRQLEKASSLLAGVRLDVKQYVTAGDQGDETVLLISEDLNTIISVLEKRLALLEEAEHLGDADRETLEILLVDLEAFSDLFNADPLVARSFTVEIDPADQEIPLDEDVSLSEEQTEEGSVE